MRKMQKFVLTKWDGILNRKTLSLRILMDAKTHVRIPQDPTVFPVQIRKIISTAPSLENKCDGHPNCPGVDGELAEDEEDCLDEYLRKNIVQEYATLVCRTKQYEGM